MPPTRRRFLGATALATVSSTAGCLGALGGGQGSPDRLTLPALDVGGSPGGEVVVNPAGQVTLLDFFATWCAPCKSQMGELNTIVEEFPDVHILSITSEREDEAIRQFWEDYDGTWPVAKDPDLDATQRYEANRMPTMVILDADDQEVWRHSGVASAATISGKLEDAGATSTDDG